MTHNEAETLIDDLERSHRIAYGKYYAETMVAALKSYCISLLTDSPDNTVADVINIEIRSLQPKNEKQPCTEYSTVETI